MSKKLMRSISKIIEDSGTNRITIFTNHLKIDGYVFEPEGRCEECHESFITLENALICKLEDYCVCNDDKCDCDDYICFRYDWLNINIADIVAFSIVR